MNEVIDGTECSAVDRGKKILRQYARCGSGLPALDKEVLYQVLFDLKRVADENGLDFNRSVAAIQKVLPEEKS